MVLEVIVWWELLAMPVLLAVVFRRTTQIVICVPTRTAQHSPSHIQPECGETVGLCSRVAYSLFGDGQCGCAAA